MNRKILNLHFLCFEKKMIDYNLLGGKMNRGVTVLHTLEVLKEKELNGEEKFRASVLGWAIEWMQAYFLIADDIMDASITRRGKDCYYRSQHV